MHVFIHNHQLYPPVSDFDFKILFRGMCFHHPKCITFHLHRCFEWLPSRKQQTVVLETSQRETSVNCVTNDKTFYQSKALYNKVGRDNFDKMRRPFPVSRFRAFLTVRILTPIVGMRQKLRMS